MLEVAGVDPATTLIWKLLPKLDWHPDELDEDCGIAAPFTPVVTVAAARAVAASEQRMIAMIGSEGSGLKQYNERYVVRWKKEKGKRSERGNRAAL